MWFKKKEKKLPQKDEVLFENSRCAIKYDEDGKVRISGLSSDDLSKVAEISSVVTDLNNIPLSRNTRKAYGTELKNIYLMALNNENKNAQEYAIKLKKIMEREILLQRKLQYIGPALCAFLTIILASYLTFLIWPKDIFYIFMFGSLGGVISLIVQQNKIEIDYNVPIYIILAESIKRVILTISMGAVGYIGIRSEVLFANFDIMGNKYVLFLIIIVCGYSSTLIPNMLDGLIQSDISIKKDDDKKQ